ncbi:MAG: VWA domain-containing protein [Acidobacteria bacterium]|nr:VWA domain-containing protein [Acidobacteriota bacterium]
MRAFIWALFIFLLFSPAADFFAIEDRSAAKFSVSVNLVKVPISLFDEGGRMVTDLKKEDFRVWEDQTLQEIRSFGRDTGPVSVVLLLDASESGRKERDKIEYAAGEFTRVLATGDRVCVVTFDERVSLDLDWTEDMKKARKALSNIRNGLRTALYDAMYLAAKEQLMHVEGRKAVVLLTDCLDNFSRVGFSEASRKIVESQAALYVISKTVLIRKDAKNERRVRMLTDIYRRLFGPDQDYVDEFFDRKEAEMTGLAESTGGRCFFPEDYDRIQGHYSDIAREMKSQYYLTYVSNREPEPDTFHRISVEYLKPSSRLVYRKSYYYRPRAQYRPQALEPAFAEE